MPEIYLETIIYADIEKCFDLARSIDLHKISTANTNEIAIDGTTSGLINLNECVTWQAVHFGIKQQLTSKITVFERPFIFRDEQVKGIFKIIKHDHLFEQKKNYVLMKDKFYYEAPFGWAGKIFNKIILTKYLKKLLEERNKIIKKFAEGEKWREVLK